MYVLACLYLIVYRIDHNEIMSFFAFIIAVPTPKCATRASRYGCCWDNKTEAKSYAGEGCPGKEKY